jgi:hypothetical protein
MTRFLGLLGPAGSGKSLAAKHLVDRYGAKVYTLAAPLKELVGSAFGLSHDQLYGSQESKERVDERYNVSPRWLLQHIGTEGIRKVFGPDFWWEYLLKCVQRDKPTFAVCDDVRFANEAAGLQSAGAKIVKLVNDKVKPRSNHASETEWLNAPHDFTIQHDGETIEQLTLQLDKCCLELLRFTPTSML